jgi:hypothetical protein
MWQCCDKFHGGGRRRQGDCFIYRRISESAVHWRLHPRSQRPVVIYCRYATICATCNIGSHHEINCPILFPLGTALGRLIHHKQAWFAKDIELFSGSGSSVNAIAWRGDVVAWADASQVRLMDVTTQVAICYLNRYLSAICNVAGSYLLSAFINFGVQSS